MMGKNAVYIFGATSNAGMKSRGSYLLHWKLLEKLKQNHSAVYDLNGINPARNPGTYKFKNDLGGINSKEVYYLGRFDAHASILSHWCVKYGETLRMIHETCRELPKTARSLLSRKRLDHDRWRSTRLQNSLKTLMSRAPKHSKR
jgi:lipid II:glycine glycyltransferase (peptidoglycan interpeptide bridge formation enzyme)